MRLELRGITKRFGTFTANDSIDLTVEAGEIHCLLGENGAGKSTLMNVLYGLYRAEEGEILLDGETRHFASPGDAMRSGIGMVHQHFMLIPVFTVAENVLLGHERRLGGIQGARQKVKELSERFGFDIDPDALVQDLAVGVQQRVEIIKALSLDAGVLVFDEPTAVLTPQETDELMEVMRQLRDEGTAIVFITHKLREVRAVADKITVIRLGKIVGSAEPTASSAELASLMVGRSVSLNVEKDDAELTDNIFDVKNLTVLDKVGHKVVNDVSFSVRGGEVLCVAGVQGNGQTELTETIIGLLKAEKGTISLNGRELTGKSVREVLDAGVGFVPEDRKVDGLVAEFSVAENVMLDRYIGAPFVKGATIDFAARDAFAEQAKKDYDVRAQSIHAPASSLSGGNQQKVVLARELGRELDLFVASQPTRGLDVGSIEFVHKQIISTRDSGIPVIVVSTELDEVVGLADRIAVMYRGGIVGIVPADTDREDLGIMMAGELPKHLQPAEEVEA
ncbi:MAG TPA: ABC transporter ATP-binding protein [Candidatus Agrococcus pullicola]|uniref:ABC transporter ATP-binding protein n=1 Tax=Candidatus Agrococcus pullicola TaxID=2838429 RepID=A0A9D1YXE7_9MICO|nr:ABC transporter ATP-binding protein [Candidatus Agrococcus pullicola]